MNNKTIYRFWLCKNFDLRYLRPKRWDQIEKVINDYDVKTVLEFGSGVSTLLFDNLRLKVTSLETDLKYMQYVKSLCSCNVDFVHWKNDTVDLQINYDLSLVDGILPRGPQIDLAVKHADIVAVDDCTAGMKKALAARLKYRLDNCTTSLAIFDNRREK